MYKLYCRIYQLVLKIGSYFLNWRKPSLLQGADSINKLPRLIKNNKTHKVLIVTDTTITSLGLMEGFLRGLGSEDIDYVIYNKTVSNPTIENIEEALVVYKANGCKGIVAFGGGSPMDCAKGVGARIARPNKSIPQMKGLLKVRRKIPPLYAVPTTSGSGSEATIAAVITNSATYEKYTVNDTALIPHYAVLDPKLTVGIPQNITSTTGMDALTHAIEAYIGKSNTKETKLLSTKAIKLIFENIHQLYLDGSNLKARENMQKASYYAGVAFTRAYVGYVHAIAHTLGGLYNIPHGLANAVILPYVLEYYGKSVHKSLAELADLTGISQHGDNEQQKSDRFIEAIKSLNERLDIPKELVCIIDSDLPLMVERALKEANPFYPVPKILNRKDLFNIYQLIRGKELKTNGAPRVCGYTGKFARINLTSGKVDYYPITDKDREMFLGGKTLAAKVIYDSFKGKVEAFSEENVIVITTSPLTGSTAPCSSRFNISTISPLTGLLISSNCGGEFGINLKRAGYDGIVISGKSKEKVFIEIKEGKILIKNAEHLWGKNTSEVQEILGGKNIGKLVIGIAGENMVRYAAVISGERAAGRGGVGAVFGFKNLKGLVASGKVSIDIFNKNKFKKHNQNWIIRLRKHALTGKQLPKLGTAGLVSMMHYRNQLATKNYTSGSYAEFEKISGETLRQDHLVKNKGCITCPIQCGRVVKAYSKIVKGPELETLGLLGSNLLNNNLQNIININHLCDEYGIDTISFGSTVGLAMELNEKRLWDNNLNFGDCSCLEDLVEKVATREGIGNELAEGTKRVSHKYGGRDFAMNVKGLEIAAYEPRAAQGMGLGYATANRGGCHLNGGYLVVLEGLGLGISGTTTTGKAALTVFFQDFMEAVSAGGTCIFATYALLPEALLKNPNKGYVRFANKCIPYFGWLVRILHNNTWLMNFNLKNFFPFPYSIKLVTGSKMNIGKFIKAGERGYNLERLINLRQELKGSDDTLPKRFTDELLRTHDPESKVKLEKMLIHYYKIRGWDKDGVPKKRRLKQLGLENYRV